MGAISAVGKTLIKELNPKCISSISRTISRNSGELKPLFQSIAKPIETLIKHSGSSIQEELQIGTVALIERAGINDSIKNLLKANGIKPKELVKYISDIAKETTAIIKNKSESLAIMKKQFSEIIKTDSLYILNLSKNNSIRGTSYKYMSEWFAEANNLDFKKIITPDKIQKIINSSMDSKITIIVPDDVALSGRSLIIDTINAFNNVTLNGKKINLVISPNISTVAAQKAIRGFSSHKIEDINSILNSQDRNNNILERFFSIFGDNINVTMPENVVIARPFYQTDSYLKLKKEKPALGEIIRKIFIMNNEKTGYGFGRNNQNGLIVLTPKGDGISLKSPNNNCAGGESFAMALGINPTNIRKPNNYRNMLQYMYSYIGFDKYFDGFFTKWIFNTL